MVKMTQFIYQKELIFNKFTFHFLILVTTYLCYSPLCKLLNHSFQLLNYIL